jgi:hypothetical protein
MMHDAEPKCPVKVNANGEFLNNVRISRHCLGISLDGPRLLGLHANEFLIRSGKEKERASDKHLVCSGTCLPYNWRSIHDIA